MVSLISSINLIIILVIILLLFSCYLYTKTIKTKIATLNKDVRITLMEKKDYVIEESMKSIYSRQLYDYELEDYFLNDIYINLPNDELITNVENDYFTLFKSCINSIITNKKMFETKFQDLDDPTGLQYKYYIPVVKFAKYSMDYEKYLEKTSQQRFTLRVETEYPHFKDAQKYYVTLDNGKCKKLEHILYFVTEAIKLYTNFKSQVDNCLYHDVCNVPPPANFVKVSDIDRCIL